MADEESVMALVWPAALGKGIERAATVRGTGWRTRSGWQVAAGWSKEQRLGARAVNDGGGGGRGGSESGRPAAELGIGGHMWAR